jgi:hypothetical protein
MNINETIAEVLRLDEEATQGPWEPFAGSVVREGETAYLVHGGPDTDAALVAYYRTAAPALAREVQRLQAEVDVLEGRAWVCQGPDCYAIHPMTTAPVLGEYPEDGDVFCSPACLDAYNRLGDEVIE